MILEKQEVLSSYKSKGFLDAHPDVKSVLNEIENLRHKTQVRASKTANVWKHSWDIFFG